MTEKAKKYSLYKEIELKLDIPTNVVDDMLFIIDTVVGSNFLMMEEFLELSKEMDEIQKTPVLVLDKNGMIHKETWEELKEVEEEKLNWKTLAKYLGEHKAAKLETEYRLAKQQLENSGQKPRQGSSKEWPANIKMIIFGVNRVLTQEKFQKDYEKKFWEAIKDHVGEDKLNELTQASDSHLDWQEEAIMLALN